MTARVGETNTVDLVLEPMPDLPVGTSRTDSVRSIDLPVHFVGDSTTFTCDACRVYALPIGSANRRVTVQWDPTVGQLLGAWVLKTQNWAYW